MFEDLLLERGLRLALDNLALAQATPVQLEAVPAALEGGDLLISARTGSGKTLAYLIPAIQRILASDGGARAGTLASTAVTLAAGRDVAAIPGFSDGRVSVQDEAAQLAAPLLAPRAGERVLDACAAPGGKALHLLELEPEIALLACDSSAERLERVEENAARLNLPLAVACADLRSPPQEIREQGPFDAILLDVPCSATGVIRRTACQDTPHRYTWRCTWHAIYKCSPNKAWSGSP